MKQLKPILFGLLFLASIFASFKIYNNEQELRQYKSDVVEIMCRNIKELAELADINTQMSYYGITSNDISFLAEEAMKQTRLLVNNPREITQKVAEDIYWKVL